MRQSAASHKLPHSHFQTPVHLTRTSVTFPHPDKSLPHTELLLMLRGTLPHTPSLSVRRCSPSMAFHAAALLTISLLILRTSPAQGGANDAEDCCLSVNKHPIPGKIVRGFRFLQIQDGCRVPAVVFTTHRGRQLCAPPDQPWVDHLIRRLQKNSTKSKFQSS